MSDYIESEASEDSNLSEDEVVAQKRPKIEGSSSEDSEEDEIPNEDEICRKEGAGWLVDEDENSEQESEGSKKDKNSDDEDEEDLDDEDFDLIQENKKRRVFLEDDDDEDFQKNRNNDKEKIAREIFESDDENDIQPSSKSKKSSHTYQKPQLDLNALVEDEDEDQQEYNEDDMDDFIVQDGDPSQRQIKQKKKQYIHQDAALQEAQDIFGVDFDQSEFDKIGNYEAEHDDQGDEEDDYDSQEDEGERAIALRAQRIPKEVLEKNVHQIFDPTELERAYFSKKDEKIRKIDIPERFQLRKYPLKIIDDQPSQTEIEDITNEADFIFNQIFKHRPNLDKDHGAIKACIVRTLRILRDGSEVPFIALYRQESIDPHLKIDDLWKIYEYDEKWCAIQHNKTSIIKVLQKLVNFFDSQLIVPEIADDILKKTTVEDKKQQVLKLIAQCRTCESLEEVEDVRQYYLLHLVEFSDSVKNWERSQNEKNGDENDEISQTRNSIENCLVTLSIDPVSGRTIKQRRARTTASYELAKRAKISGFVKRFGLSASQFAQNLNEQYVHHEVDQYPTLPLDAATDFVCPQFSTPEAILKASRYMLALEISRELMVKKAVRQLMRERCIINISPTKLGIRDIDESHPLFKIKYIKMKPYEDLLNDPIYIQIDNAVKDGLLNFELTQYIIQGVTLEDDLSRFFYKDEFSSLVQSWNDQRRMIIKESLDTFLIPQILKELKQKLLESSQQAVLDLCSQKINNYLSIAPYRENSGEIDENDGDIYTRRNKKNRYQNEIRRIWPLPSRVLAISIQEQDSNHLPLMTSVMLDPQGEIVDILHSPNFLMFDKGNISDEERNLHDRDKQALSNFIQKHNPQVLVIGCDCRRAVRLQKHVQDLISGLQSSRKLSENCNIKVELVETELANVFALSKTAAANLPSSYNLLTKKAISLGRRMQDPLLEFAQLMNYDQEILGMRLHPLQDFISKEALYKAIEIQFVNRVNEVGVDINRALDHQHTSHVVQFISGLGPRKAVHLIKTLKTKKMHLTKRMQLVTECEFGPRVVVNCAGFIKIDTEMILANDEDVDEIEILDSTRIHPECSDLAKKMAMDALEYEEEEGGGNKSDEDDDDEDDDDNLDSDDSGYRQRRKKKNKKKNRKEKMEPNPTAALEEIIKSPGKLRDLDLDAFADELKRQGHGDKRLTLYAIRRELNQRYADFRKPYESPSQESIFTWVTKETPDTLHIGSLVQGTLTQIVTKPPKSDQLDNANPQKIESTGRWMCPFCRQNDFLQLNHVWAHFDNNECPGRPVGLQVNLDNPTINGFVPLKLTDFRSDDKLSEDENKKNDIFTQFPIGILIQARVMKIDVSRFSVELNSKESVLKDERNVYRINKDNYYDFEKEEEDQIKLKEEKLKEEAELAKKNQYFSRVIFHPNFKNISYDQLMTMESTIAVGDVVIRPSSKGTQNLTLSWKIDTGIFKHYNIKEEKKAVAYALGKKLILENEVYDDLDEIIARFVQPLTSLLNEIMANKSYRDTKGGSKTLLDEMLRKDKSANPDRIPYFFTALLSHPAYFLLGYMPNQRSHFETFSITIDGFRFRKMIFPTLNRLLAWFKEHYNDPIMRNYHAVNTPKV